MVQHLAATKIKRTIKHSTPSSKDLIYNPGDKVLVWRGNVVNNWVDLFIGPYAVLSFDPKPKIAVIDQDGEKKRYTVAYLRTFFAKPTIVDNSITEHAFEHGDKDSTGDICQAKRVFGSEKITQCNPITIISLWISHKMSQVVSLYHKPKSPVVWQKTCGTEQKFALQYNKKAKKNQISWKIV